MNAAQLINATTGNFEWYTPTTIVEAARLAMGSIDLDPASSSKANERVRATCYWGPNHDVMDCQWHGNVWMNHPFSREHNAKWIGKLVAEAELGHIDQACCITFAATSEKWFRPLLCYPQCFLYPRTNYLLPDGTIKRGVTKGSVVTYLGPNVQDFAAAFAKLGSVKIAYA